MNNDSHPPTIAPEQFDPSIQPSVEPITIRARVKRVPRWITFAGIGCGCLAALVVFLTMSGIVGKVLPRPSGIPLSVQQTATAELLTTNGRPELGGLIARFIKVYGQPSSNSSPSDGLYDFNTTLEVFTSQENKRVNAASFLNTDGSGWVSVKSAIHDCENFIPGDALYQHTVELYNPSTGVHTGTERIYLSPSLGSLFQASDFTDEHGQVTTLGTFGIVFHYDIPNNPSHIIDCNPQIGLEKAQT